MFTTKANIFGLQLYSLVYVIDLSRGDNQLWSNNNYSWLPPLTDTETPQQWCNAQNKRETIM